MSGKAITSRWSGGACRPPRGEVLRRLPVLLASMLLVPGASLAQTDDDPYDYTIINGDGTVYPHAEDACQAAYQADVLSIHKKYPDSAISVTKILPYQSPVFDPDYSDPPTFMGYDCNTSYQIINPNGGAATNLVNLNVIQGKQKDIPCPDGQVKNEITGQCEKPDEDQQRKELGSPGDLPLGGVVTCAGNPVSIASGNKFQEEEDFRDSNGELVFKRYYNGFSGDWTASYGANIINVGNTILLTFEDGRSTIFTLTNGVPVGEPTEQGSLQNVNGQWVYSAPDNTSYTFDAAGILVGEKLADGRAQSITYTVKASGEAVFTVTDSGGRTLQFVKDSLLGSLESLTASGLSITYTIGPQNPLIKVTKTWAGHTTSRSYVYEDANNPFSLTGIIDERGVRYATWHYDSQGRAVSSTHANGAEQVTITYPDSNTTVVTNSLGHNVTYHYQVIQGIKRVTAIEGEPTAGCPASNTTYTYTARGQVQTKTDALGAVTAYEYDTLGRETKRVEAQSTPQERTTTTTWDATRFLPLTVTTPERVTTYTYDDQGRLLSSSVHAVKE